VAELLSKYGVTVKNNRLAITYIIPQISRTVSGVSFTAQNVGVEATLNLVHLHLSGRNLTINFQLGFGTSGSASASGQLDLQSTLNKISLPAGVSASVQNGKLVLLVENQPTFTKTLYGLSASVSNLKAKLVLDSFYASLSQLGTVTFSVPRYSATVLGLTAGVENLSASLSPSATVQISSGYLNLNASTGWNISGNAYLNGTVDVIQLLSSTPNSDLSGLVKVDNVASKLVEELTKRVTVPTKPDNVFKGIDLSNASVSYQLKETNGNLEIILGPSSPSVSLGGISITLGNLSADLLVKNASVSISNTLNFNLSSDFAVSSGFSANGTVNLRDYIPGVNSGQLTLNASASFSVSAGANLSGQFTLDQLVSIPYLNEFAGKAVSWLVGSFSGVAPNTSTNNFYSQLRQGLSYARTGLTMAGQAAKIYENITGDHTYTTIVKILTPLPDIAKLGTYLAQYWPEISKLIDYLRSSGNGGGSGGGSGGGISWGLSWNGWEPTFSGAYSGTVGPFKVYGFNLSLSNPQGSITIKNASGTVSGPNSSFSINLGMRLSASGGINVTGSKSLSEILNSSPGSGGSGSGAESPNITAEFKVEGGKLVLYLYFSDWNLNPVSGLNVGFSGLKVRIQFDSVNVNLGNGQIQVNVSVGFNVSDNSTTFSYTGSTTVLSKDFTYDIPVVKVPFEVVGIPVELDVYASLRVSKPTISVTLGPDLTQQQLNATVSFNFVGASPGVGVSVVGYPVASVSGGIAIGFSNPAFSVSHSTSGWVLTVKTGTLDITTVTIVVKVLGQQVATINVPAWSYTLWNGGTYSWNVSQFSASLSSMVDNAGAGFRQGVQEFLYKWANDVVKNASGWANAVNATIRQMVANGLYNVSQAINNGWISLNEALQNGWITVWNAIRFHNHQVMYTAPAWTVSYPSGWTYVEEDPSRNLKAPSFSDADGDGRMMYVYAEPAYLSTDEHRAYWWRMAESSLGKNDGPIPPGIKMAFNGLYRFYGDGELDSWFIRFEVLEDGVWKTVAEHTGSGAVDVNSWKGFSGTYVTTGTVTKIRVYMMVRDYEGVLGGEECGMAFDAFQIQFSRAGEFKTTTLNPTEDAAVSQLNPSSNYGSDSKLRVETYDWLLTRSDWRSYLKFSLNSLPSDAIITKAELRLYCTQADGGAVSGEVTVVCHYTNDSWSEGGITWNNQPMGTDPNPNTGIMDSKKIGGGSEPHAVNQWISWNVLGAAIDAFNNDKVVSFMLREGNEAQWAYGIWAEFYSRQGSYAPQLYIEYFDP
jgi:hypothetical protein